MPFGHVTKHPNQLFRDREYNSIHNQCNAERQFDHFDRQKQFARRVNVNVYVDDFFRKSCRKRIL